MKNSTEILNELLAISPFLAGIDKVNVYKVPVGYFENLEERISTFAISNNNSELFFNTTNIQQVPDGYFDTLSSNILAKIKTLYPETADEELRKLSPMLHSLKNKNVFEVPDAYFENLSYQIVSKVEPTTAKIIVMKPRNNWLKIAAAAVVTGAIAISSLSIFNRSQQDNPNAVIAAAAPTMPSYIKESFQFKTEQDVDAGLAKLSDDDIIKYLEKNGNVLDNELLLKNSDETGLPSQDDYLIDENTLNTYLDKIDAESKTN